MASRTTTDPIEILLEMGVDLDNLSEEEDYLSALKEAIATIQFQTKGAGDERSTILQQEVVKVRKQRKAADPKFKARKTKISADVFKKGSATGTNVAPKALPTSAIVSYQAPEAEEDGEEKKKRKKKPKEKNLLADIAKSVVKITDVLKEQYGVKKKSAEFDRKKAEQEKRALQKSKLSKGFEALVKGAQKVIAPVQSLLSRIFGFLFNLLLGKFIMKLLDWIGDPKNREKFFSVVRFLKDNWPKLIALYLVFGNSIGKFIFNLTKTLISGAVKLTIAIAKLMAAKKIKGARGVARFLGKRGGLIGAGVATALTVGGAMAVTNAVAGGGEEQQTQAYSGGGYVKPAPEMQPLPKKVTQERSGMSGAQKGMALGSMFGPLGMLAGAGIGSLFDNFGKNKEDKIKLSKPSEVTLEVPAESIDGGQVDGPGGIDKVPAMLTDGEFVMSRGAVQKIGVDKLEAMNAAGGGTNKPKVVDNKVYASVGGYIGNLIGLGKKGTPDPEKENKSSSGGYPQEKSYSTGSLASDPLGALDRILGQSSGGKFRLPGSGSEPPKSKPESKPKEPLIPGKADPLPPEEPGIPEKMLKSPTFRDSGLLYLRHLMGGLGGAITEQDLSKETKHELNLAIGRAKERHAGNLAKATREWEEAKKGGWDKSSSKEGRDAYATRKSQYERLKSGQVQVLYQDYYDGNNEKNITKSAENAKSVLGQFWAQQTKEGGYRIVNEKYDFQPMNDPLAVLMGDSRGIAKDAKDGKPGQEISLRNKLQAIAQLNPFTKDMSVDMILGQPESAERKTNNILRKMGGFLDFIMRDTTDFDGQGVVASNEAKGEMGVPFPTKPETPLLPEKTQEKLDAKPKLTAQQIKNNQAYAESKGKYYSSTTNKTYANYAAALKDPAVAAGAEKMEQKKQSTMNMILGGKDAYYSSTTGMYYKNYAEALKDPKVAAAAKVEKTKASLSFPTPSMTMPEPPPGGGNNVKVIRIPSSATPDNPNDRNTGGSDVDAAATGNGNKAKWNILGIPMPF
jgi:hypothetical protein